MPPVSDLVALIAATGVIFLVAAGAAWIADGPLARWDERRYRDDYHGNGRLDPDTWTEWEDAA